MKRLNLFFALLLALLTITGCAANQDNRYGSTNNNVDTRNVNNPDMNRQDINYNNVNNNNNNESRLEVADKAANKVTDLEEVRQANVMVTNANAYVAVILEGQPKGDVTREVEQKISRAVKSTDRDIQNVFVSSNPDFVDRMTDYGDRVQQGEPIEGLVDEFNEMVRRIFPNAR